MNAYEEEALKQEVIYLHSLWHQGPPMTRIPHPTRNPHPFRRLNYIPPTHLPHFPGPVRNPNNARNQNLGRRHHPYNRSRPGPDPGPEWPVEAPPSPLPASGWRKFKTPGSGNNTRVVSADEIARFSAAKLQKDVLRICGEFFAARSKIDGSDDDVDEDYLLGKEEEEEKEKELKSFFARLFEENGELKGYYERNHGNGEFCCLVCGGGRGGEKKGRKFKSCLALVQHSLAIYKTDMTKAHRVFAKVVCDVLGWDINNPVASVMAAGNSKETTMGDGGSKQAQSFESGVQDSEATKEGAADSRESGASTKVEWPSRWPLKPERTSETRAISAEEQARMAAEQIQKNVVKACEEFFVDTVCSGSSEKNEDEDDGDSVDEDLFEESEEFKFFLKIFVENSELRSYYEKNYESGNFVCLVCAGTGKNLLKRFKGCAGLLIHAAKVLKTKKKLAHRVFACVICKVFGWDFDRLPMLVVKGDPLGGSNVNQSEGTTNIDDVNKVHNEALDEDEANKHPRCNDEGTSVTVVEES